MAQRHPEAFPAAVPNLNSRNGTGARRGKQRAPTRCSARATKGTTGNRGLVGSVPGTMTPSPDQGADAARDSSSAIGFDATVMGLGQLRTTAHINAKQPLYNFLARCKGTNRRVGDAEYWRGQVETWCKEEGMRLIDISTKQVSLYLRQMAQDPSISRYYGITKVEQRAPFRFALEGRPFDWSRYDRDNTPPAGWDATTEKDGARAFTSRERGANVEVRIRKPSYAQVCELEAIEVNGMDSTPGAAFKPACDLGVFTTPEGLHKMLDAVGSVALCAGIIKDYIRGDFAGAGTDSEGLSRLLCRAWRTIASNFAANEGCAPPAGYRYICTHQDPKRTVSAILGMVGVDDVLWAAKCARVTVGASEEKGGGEKSDGSHPVRRCDACNEYLETMFLPMVREAVGSGAADGDERDSEDEHGRAATPEPVRQPDEHMKKSELGTKRSRDGRRRDPTGENAQIVSSSSSFDEQHGGVLREDLGNTLKREHIYPGNCRQPTENASFAWGGVEASFSPWRADGDDAQRGNCVYSTTLAPTSSARDLGPHVSGGDNELLEAALGLSTLRTVPPDRWTFEDGGREHRIVC